MREHHHSRPVLSGNLPPEVGSAVQRVLSLVGKSGFDSPAIVLAAALLLGAARPATSQDVTVRTRPDDEGWIGRDAPIEIQVDRDADPPTGRLAIFIGDTDWTELFRPTDEGLRYDGAPLPLPSGEHDLVVYRATDEGWNEVGREQLQVLGRGGIREATLDPAASLSLEGPVAASYDPSENAPDRDTYQDLEGELKLQADLDHTAFSLAAEARLQGTSHRESALRFSELDEEAPRIDLSSYRVGVGRSGQRLSVGHVSFGGHRHLIRGFSSRGARVDLAPGERVDASFAALNGARMVGWSNPVGLDDPGHRVLAGMVGADVIEGVANLRVEVTGMDGAVRPTTGFNQGAVTDSEESQGWGVHLEASDRSRRAAVEAGFARSSFTNPRDPELAGESDIVEVEERTSSARYFEGSLAVLQNRTIAGDRTASLDVAYRHTRVDPLYRTVASFARADRLQHTVDVRSRIAGVSLQASHARSEDNLDEVPSVLKSRTRRTSGSVDLPLARVLGATGTEWLPALRYQLDRTHQFGVEIPTNGGFSAGHVPDQLSRDRTLSADWRLGRFSVGYRHNRSHQDNRQEGREDADFFTRVHGVSARGRVHARLSLNGRVERSRSENVAREEFEEVTRYSLGGEVVVTDRTTLSLSFSKTVDGDDAGLRERISDQFNAQLSSVLPWIDRWDGSFFVRYDWRANEAFDRTFGTQSDRSRSTVNTGLNLSFF